MHLAKKVGLLVAAAAVWGAASVDASAQVGGGSPFLAYGFWGNGLYSMSYQSPPFYALFPPVYYSYPIPRPYGYSPFAYPPGFTTPEAEPIQAKELANPYVPPKPVSPTSNRTAAAPKVILNPYVTRRSQPALAARPIANDDGPQLSVE